MNADVRHYQRLFREVNTQIAAINADRVGRQGEFLCECARTGCIATIMLDLEEFEKLRAEQDVFVVAPGHGVEGVDRLLESRDDYDLVTTDGN